MNRLSTPQDSHSCPQPSLLADIARALGDAAAARLASTYGGRRVYVPRTPTRRFSAAVGNEVAAWLSRAFGGEFISVPLGSASRHARVAAEVAGLTRAGHTAGEIAASLGISERSVHRIRARSRHAGPPRPHLFSPKVLEDR